MKYIRYLWYVVKHRWFVTVECWRRGLYWRGLVHDLSKFRPSEFLPYAEHFYGRRRGRGRDGTGYYKPTDTGDPAFDRAWFLHQKRNDHHWQWWIFPEDGGAPLILAMSHAARVEMVCDWIGASRAQGGDGDVRPWYRANKLKLALTKPTRDWVEAYLRSWTHNNPKGA
jgi:hypothetical protein